ncbi:MAG: hypothetical protein H6908_02490 [Hyphomicrobiales bacterium]|nr:hypothetical protein [Rickettsiales bacterium]MCP5361500.1 hypothetical protein [Hyphomicrobiales bacterium]
MSGSAVQINAAACAQLLTHIKNYHQFLAAIDTCDDLSSDTRFLEDSGARFYHKAENLSFHTHKLLTLATTRLRLQSGDVMDDSMMEKLAAFPGQLEIVKGLIAEMLPEVMKMAGTNDLESQRYVGQRYFLELKACVDKLVMPPKQQMYRL